MNTHNSHTIELPLPLLSRPGSSWNTVGSPSSIWRALAVIAVCAIAFCVSVHAQTPPSPDCKAIAYLPPMATFGGPNATARGDTELGLALGGYDANAGLPVCFDEVAEYEMMRFRRGVSDRLDFGFDVLFNNQSDNTIGTATQAAVRYLATPGLRLEGSVGVGDGEDGRDPNADVAAVLGTHDQANTWNYYMSLRLAGSHGCLRCGDNTSHSPGALVPLGVIGATARVSGNSQFVMETGLGGTFARQYATPALYIHFSCGIQFKIPREPRRTGATH